VLSSSSSSSLYKNTTIAANSFQVLEPGITLAPQNSITVRGNSNLTFSTYGLEIS
jgi:hypothetical protein